MYLPNEISGIDPQEKLVFHGQTSVAGEMVTENVDVTRGFQCQFEPGSYTITFSRSVIDDAGGVGIQATEAEIIWSIGGNPTTRRVSVVDGMSISSVAEEVSVTIRDVSSGNANLRYYVSAGISKGVRPSIQMPPRLRDLGSTYVIPNPGSQSIPVPQKCGITSVLILIWTPVTTPGMANVLIEQSTGAGDAAIYDETYKDFIPLFPGCVELVITNMNSTGGGQSVQASVIWGIDG